MENERDDKRLKETYELAWTAQKCKPKRASVSIRRHYRSATNNLHLPHNPRTLNSMQGATNTKTSSKTEWGGKKCLSRFAYKASLGEKSQKVQQDRLCNVLALKQMGGVPLRSAL